MKKVIISILVVLMACSFAFAADEPERYGNDIDFTYAPTMARYSGMGQSGIANTQRIDSFYLNPANIPFTKAGLSIPSVSLTVYNIQKIVSDPVAMEDFNAMVEGTATDAQTADFAAKYLENLGKGRNAIAKIDAGLALKVGVLGLGTDVQVKLHTLNDGSSLATAGIIPEVNLAQTVALGVKIIDERDLSVSLGVAGHFVFKGYFKAIDGSTLMTLMSSSEDISETLLWDTPFMAGYAVPIDAGVTVGLLRNDLKLALTVNNINGKYKMTSNTGFGDFVNTVSEGTMQPPEGHPANTPTAFEIMTDPSVTFGASYSHNFAKLLCPTVSVDFVDVVGLFKEAKEPTFRASDLLLHMNAGAEIKLLSSVAVRAGINQGYASIGCGLVTPLVQVNASYGFQEFGAEIGDKPVDSFTISVNIGGNR